MVTTTDLTVYPAPEGAEGNDDFSVRVRTPGGGWKPLFVYKVKVDMHDVREASMVTFDCSGPVEIEAVSHRGVVQSAIVRPYAAEVRVRHEADTVTLLLDGPRLLSLERNGDRFRNLHIFANPLAAAKPEEKTALVLQPGTHRAADIRRALEELPAGQERRLRFAPGLHKLEEALLELPSHTRVTVDGGAVLYGGFVCDRVEHVHIGGKGILYLSDYAKTTYYRGFQIQYSRHITIEDLTVIDPPHYTVLLGQSEHIGIRNLKSFSSRGWCDGIDMMACRNVDIEGGFLRTSDDCIAVYASRGEFKGDTSAVSVRGAVLWADVAHPVNIGTHGDYEGEGNVIEGLRFSDLHILEHHEPQPDYWGCLAINAGDNNTVRDVVFENIAVGDFELGELFNLRVLRNEKYNPAPGRRIANIRFRHIHFKGRCMNPSHIAGYDETRVIEDVVFEDVTVNGEPFRLSGGHAVVGSHVLGLSVKGGLSP